MPFAARHYPFEDKAGVEKNYPAQFISEYIAQTRAWFYTMHVLSVGIFGTHAFENVLTTGTILAEDGSKMSKSKKNYPDPALLINEMGADSLRLYLMSSSVMKSENLNFSEKEVADIRRKIFVIWWNVLGFYHSFAAVGAPEKPAAPSHILDRWILSRLQTLIVSTARQFDEYEVARASRNLMEFVSDLSNWYLRLSRERLKAADNTEASRVFGYVLYTLAQLFAPLTPFFSELVHHSMVDEKTSIHLTDWPNPDASLQDAALESAMETVRKAVEAGHASRKEQALKVRQPLASVTITVPAGSQPPSGCNTLIEQELNVKKVVWKSENETSLSVKFDTKLTPELKEEGEAREIMRTIQGLRRKAGLKMGESATVKLPAWPSAWQAEIEAKTATRLIKGEAVTLITE
jgi:isoleucyl-tRNA synthetase